jgi:uncharacterized delta-60 repeat protein
MIATLVVGLSAFPAGTALAAPGDLDPAFDADGKVTANFTRRVDFGWATAIQDDGKIIVVGTAGENSRNPRFAVARFNPDGTLDESFDGDGKLTKDLTEYYDGAFGVVIQSDGKIVVSGDAGLGGPNSGFAVVRFNTDGSLDTTFGVGGADGDGVTITQFSRRTDTPAGMAIQPDDKILVSGCAAYDGRDPKMAVVRYTADGDLDSTFGGDGKVTTDFDDDPGFDFASAVAVADDGDIVAAGMTENPRTHIDFAAARYNEDGSLDTAFGGDGLVERRLTRYNDTGQAVHVGPDGSVLIGGIAKVGSGDASFALTRYLANGTPDVSFSFDAWITTDFTNGDDYAWGMTVDDDDRILAVGVSGAGSRNPRFAVARYSPDGELDPSFSGDGKVRTDISAGYDSARGVAIQSDGAVVVAGGAGSEFAVVRYLAA